MTRALMLGLATTLLATGCAGRLENQWQKAGYDPKARDATKHIQVAAWAEGPELARLTARIASERVKLKTNYLVYAETELTPGWSSACTREDGEALQGVLVVRVLEAEQRDAELAMALEGRLMRCSDGALLWRAEVRGSGDSSDEDLATFAHSYKDEFPEQAPRAAIPLLVNLIALLDALPDVVLTEEEELTKIELS